MSEKWNQAPCQKLTFRVLEMPFPVFITGSIAQVPTSSCLLTDCATGFWLCLQPAPLIVLRLQAVLSDPAARAAILEPLMDPAARIRGSYVPQGPGTHRFLPKRRKFLMMTKVTKDLS